MASNPLSYCGEQVRRHDSDRYLTALFAPVEVRDALFALYAFNLEVAKTREVVTEPVLGQIRLQWWREAIEEIYGEGAVRRHEVVRPLKDAVTAYRIDRSVLDGLIDAREFDLEDTPPATLDDLLAYAHGTATSVVRLALSVLVPDPNDGALQDLAGKVGIATAITGLIRAIPFHGVMRRVYLPQAIMDAHGVRERDLFDRKPSDAVAGAVRELADLARGLLGEVAKTPRPTRTVLPALLSTRLSRLTLQTLAKNGHNCFDGRVQMHHPLRQATVFWGMVTRRL